MISDGSCDTEDGSNDAEIQLCHHNNNYILKSIKIENVILNGRNISKYYCFLLYCDQIKAALMNRTLKH